MKKFFSGCLTSIVILILLIILIGSCSNGSNDSKSSGNETQKTNTKEEKKSNVKEVTKKKEPVIKLGQTVKVGNIAVKAKSKTTASVISSEKAKGVYYIVEVTTINKSNKAVTVSENDFKLINGNKEYEGDHYVTSIYNSSKGMNSNYFLEEINPDMKISGYIVFDIPKTVANKNLKLRVKPNMFLKDQVDILLK